VVVSDWIGSGCCISSGFSGHVRYLTFLRLSLILLQLPCVDDLFCTWSFATVYPWLLVIFFGAVDTHFGLEDSDSI
jgi:hypothetical protein